MRVYVVGVFLTDHHMCFKARVSNNLELADWLDWLAYQLQRSICGRILSAGITEERCHVWLLCMCWESKLGGHVCMVELYD